MIFECCWSWCDMIVTDKVADAYIPWGRRARLQWTQAGWCWSLCDAYPGVEGYISNEPKLDADAAVVYVIWCWSLCDMMLTVDEILGAYIAWGRRARLQMNPCSKWTATNEPKQDANEPMLQMNPNEPLPMNPSRMLLQYVSTLKLKNVKQVPTKTRW